MRRGRNEEYPLPVVPEGRIQHSPQVLRQAGPPFLAKGPFNQQLRVSPGRLEMNIRDTGPSTSCNYISPPHLRPITYLSRESVVGWFAADEGPMIDSRSVTRKASGPLPPGFAPASGTAGD